MYRKYGLKSVSQTLSAIKSKYCNNAAKGSIKKQKALLQQTNSMMHCLLQSCQLLYNCRNKLYNKFPRK